MPLFKDHWAVVAGDCKVTTANQIHDHEANRNSAMRTFLQRASAGEPQYTMIIVT